MAAKLPLTVRKNIRDNWESKSADLIGTLNSATGVTWTFNINFDYLYAKADPSLYCKENIGGAAFWVMEGLVGNLVSKVSDEMVKEALLDACPKKTLTLTLGEIKKSYFDVRIEDGGILVVYKPDNLGTNVSDVGSDIESLL